ncbi:MAG: DNA-formamidopyrimidine glycosylase family protein [Actinomycetota bacterium]|nr:hypothetical protein [Actinomycetota bacterium]
MPELPEMQALAERLDNAFAGSALSTFTAYSFVALKTVQPPADTLRGATLRSVGRRGKFLIFGFGDARILIHLSQGGRIDVEEPPKKTKPRGALARFTFQARALLFKEFGRERKAGWWVLAPGDEGPLAALGPEATSDGFAAWARASHDTRRVHTILRDQHTVAGVGRGYADEILHRAQLSPYASMASLDAEARETLIASISDVLGEALEEERKRTGGLPAKLNDRFRIHGHAGEPCPRCGADLRRVSYESHEVAYCPACQTGGKILADRRMSRLLR